MIFESDDYDDQYFLDGLTSNARLCMRWIAIVFYGFSWWLTIILIPLGQHNERMKSACQRFQQTDTCNNNPQCKWINERLGCQATDDTDHSVEVGFAICGLLFSWAFVIFLVMYSLKRKYMTRAWWFVIPFIKQALLMIALVFNNTATWTGFIVFVLLTLPFYVNMIKGCIALLPERRPEPPAYEGPPPSYAPSAPVKEGPWQSRGSIDVRSYEGQNGEELIVTQQPSLSERFLRWLGL